MWQLIKNPIATLRSKKEKEPFEFVQPWRYYKGLKDRWTKEYYKDLLTEIKMNTTSALNMRYVNSKTVNILVLGYVQSGKSSTINSMMRILEYRISERAKSRDSGVSLTQWYDSFRCKNELDGVFLFDVIGVEAVQNQGILTEDIKMCINGQVEEAYQFNPRSKKKLYGKMLGKEIHCVIYCVSADSIFHEEIEAVRKTMQEIESELKITDSKKPERIVLVTKIDTICDETKKDIRRIFHSIKVKRAVERAARVFKVSLNNVFPIKNYTDEAEIDEYTNIPLLLGLSKAVDYGTTYLRYKATNVRRMSTILQQSNPRDSCNTIPQEQQTEIFADLLFINPSIL